MRILVIEDEKKIASFIQRGLKEEHYAVDVAYDGEQGLYFAEINSYNLIVLDIMLPGKDGIFICRELRKKGLKTPITSSRRALSRRTHPKASAPRAATWTKA